MRTQKTYRIALVLLFVGFFYLSAEAASSRQKQIQKAARGNRPARQVRTRSQAAQASRPPQQSPDRIRSTVNQRRLNEVPVQNEAVQAPIQSQQSRQPQSRAQNTRNPSLNIPLLQIYQPNGSNMGKRRLEKPGDNTAKGVNYIHTKRIIRYVGKGSGKEQASHQAPSSTSKVPSQSSLQGLLQSPRIRLDASTWQTVYRARSNNNRQRQEKPDIRQENFMPKTDSPPKQPLELDRKDRIRGERSIGTQVRRFLTRQTVGPDSNLQAPKPLNRLFKKPQPARPLIRNHDGHVAVFKKPDRKEIVVDSRRMKSEIQHFQCRTREVHVSYIDRPHIHLRRYHHIYTVLGTGGQRYYRIVRPYSLFNICYQRGGLCINVSLRPYYHRKYVFVSLGGHPMPSCSWIRYYWYGWHPYEWYGYYPLAYRIEGDTYNYYTYNYGDSEMPFSQGGTSGTVISGYHIGSADYMGLIGDQVLADDRDMKPSTPGPADIEFEKGIGAFDVNDFSTAADHFFRACQYAPEDNILALAYAQALFAENRYHKAAEVLRDVLERIKILEEGLFYPRGLYAQDEILFQQIDALIKEAERDSGNRDLQLLLGYQLMGIGEIGLAKGPLENACKDLTNNKAAKKLTSLLDIIEQQAEQAQRPTK